MDRDKFIRELFSTKDIRWIKSEQTGIVDAVWLLRSDTIKKVEKLFDDFESRTCGNCTLNERCAIQNAFVFYLKSVSGQDIKDFEGFGCSKFERKTDE